METYNFDSVVIGLNEKKDMYYMLRTLKSLTYFEMSSFSSLQGRDGA